MAGTTEFASDASGAGPMAAVAGECTLEQICTSCDHSPIGWAVETRPIGSVRGPSTVFHSVNRLRNTNQIPVKFLADVDLDSIPLCCSDLHPRRKRLAGGGRLWGLNAGTPSAVTGHAQSGFFPQGLGMLGSAKKKYGPALPCKGSSFGHASHITPGVIRGQGRTDFRQASKDLLAFIDRCFRQKHSSLPRICCGELHSVKAPPN